MYLAKNDLINECNQSINHQSFKKTDMDGYGFPNFNSRTIWVFGMDKQFHPASYHESNHLSILWLKLNHVSKMAANSTSTGYWTNACNQYVIDYSVYYTLPSVGQCLFTAAVYVCSCHDEVIKWKHFPRYWSFVRGIHRSPVNFPHKGQWRGSLIILLICTWMNGWVNNREAVDLRRHHAHYDVTVMLYVSSDVQHSPFGRLTINWLFSLPSGRARSGRVSLANVSFPKNDFKLCLLWCH